MSHFFYFWRLAPKVAKVSASIVTLTLILQWCESHPDLKVSLFHCTPMRLGQKFLTDVLLEVQGVPWGSHMSWEVMEMCHECVLWHCLSMSQPLVPTQVALPRHQELRTPDHLCDHQHHRWHWHEGITSSPHRGLLFTQLFLIQVQSKSAWT